MKLSTLGNNAASNAEPVFFSSLLRQIKRVGLPLRYYCLLFLSGCASLDLSGNWADTNAIQGNYRLDYSSMQGIAVRRLCINFLEIQNFKGFDHCLSELESNFVNEGQLQLNGSLVMSRDYTSALFNGLKAEAALNRRNFSTLPSLLESALAAVRGQPGTRYRWSEIERYRQEVAPRIFGVAAVYEGLYGAREKALAYINELEETPFEGLYALETEPRKRAWLAKAYMAVGEYELAIEVLSREEGRAGKFLYKALWAMPTSLLISAATGMAADNIEAYASLQSQAVFCHALNNLGAESASICFKQLLDHRFINVFGGLKFTALQQYGRIQLKEGDVQAARIALTEAVKLLEAQRSSLSLDTTKLGFVSDKLSVYRDLIELYVAENQPERAIEYSERAKARALVDLLASRDTQPSPKNGADLQSLLASVDDMENRLASVSLNDEAERSATRGLLRKYQESLNTAAPEFTSLRVVSSPSIAELQSMLEEGEGLLEYFGDGDDLWVFVLSQQGVSAAKLTVVGLESLIATARRDLLDPSSDHFSRSSRELYEAILEPVGERLQGFERLTVVPHAALHYVPFSALYDGQAFLIDKLELRVLPSASVLKFLGGSEDGTAESMLVLGNPDLNDPEMDLPGAELEAINIAKMRPNTDVLLRKNASEQLVKSSAEQYRYLHIASHGIFNAEDPMSSALLLSEGGGEDGLLSVAELFDLRLNADLVTLSACETALGEVTGGDDVIGFTRGFLYAGAESIVSSLWKVSDVATNQLMQNFYEGLPEQGKSAALRQAQLALKSGQYAHPYYWGAFQLTGQYD